MDASPDAVVAEVRAKRHSIDNRLELLRVRLQRTDPRSLVDRRLIGILASGLALVAGFWIWTHRQRRLHSLADLLADGVRDVFGSEHQIARAFGRMQRSATTPELRHALEQRRREAEDRLDRLQRVFRAIDDKPRERVTAGIRGITADIGTLIRRHDDPDVRDAALITLARRLVHYQIAAYGTLRAHAETLGYTYAAALLQQSFDEERMADEQLARLGERFVNHQAVRRRSAG